MRVKMNIAISGLAPDGGRWPGIGEEIDVPDHTGAKLVANGQAELVETAAPKKTTKKATASKPKAEKR